MTNEEMFTITHVCFILGFLALTILCVFTNHPCAACFFGVLFLAYSGTDNPYKKNDKTEETKS